MLVYASPITLKSIYCHFGRICFPFCILQTGFFHCRVWETSMWIGVLVNLKATAGGPVRDSRFLFSGWLASLQLYWPISEFTPLHWVTWSQLWGLISTAWWLARCFFLVLMKNLWYSYLEVCILFYWHKHGGILGAFYARFTGLSLFSVFAALPVFHIWSAVQQRILLLSISCELLCGTSLLVWILLQAGFFHGFIWMVMHFARFWWPFQLSTGTCPPEVANNWSTTIVTSESFSRFHWGIFILLWSACCPLFGSLLHLWWPISMLWRFVRSGWIDYPVLTWSRLWPILLARIGCRVGWFSFLTLLLPSLLVWCSCIVWSAGFSWIFFSGPDALVLFGGSCHSHCF